MFVFKSWNVFSPKCSRDVQFCTCARCHTSKVPVATITGGCLGGVRGTLLLMTNCQRRWWICWWAVGGHVSQGLGGVAGVWGGGCLLQPRAPTPQPTSTQPPNPPPRDPPVEQSPPSSAHLITLLPIEKEEKIKRELTLQSFKMNEMAEWDFLSFDSSVISWSNSFNPFTSPCTIGTPTLRPEVY